MLALLGFLLALRSLPFKSKSRLEAENAVLRRQLIVLQRKVRGRVRFTHECREVCLGKRNGAARDLEVGL